MRTERTEVRLEPRVAAGLDQARGLATRARWIEAAVLEKLDRDGVELAPAAPGEPPLRAEHEYPRRPMPRTTGGRGIKPRGGKKPR